MERLDQEIDRIGCKLSHTAREGKIDLLELGQILQETGQASPCAPEAVRLEARRRKQGQDALTGMMALCLDGRWLYIDELEATNPMRSLLEQMRAVLWKQPNGSNPRGLDLVTQTILSGAFPLEQEDQGRRWRSMSLEPSALEQRVRQVVGEAAWSHYQATVLEQKTRPARGCGTGLRL